MGCEGFFSGSNICRPHPRPFAANVMTLPPSRAIGWVGVGRPERCSPKGPCNGTNQYFGVLFVCGVKARSFKVSERVALAPGCHGVITKPDEAVKRSEERRVG